MPSDFKEKVTIILCAKNESTHLKENLPTWLSQKNIDFSLLIVDDGSMDDTAAIIEQYHHPKLKYLYISPEEKKGEGKKYALQRGIAEAETDWILLADADCLPINNFWARNMMSFASGYDVILGISPYKHHSSGLLTYLIDLETFFTAMQYTAWASADIPYMGVGRNMAYKKQLTKFIDTERYYSTASGDDDIFIQHTRNKAKFISNTNSDSRTYSYAPSNFKSWTRQKTRHYSTGFQYSLIHKLGLGLFIFTKIIIHSIGIYLILILSKYLSLYIIYLIVNIISLHFINKKIKMPVQMKYLLGTDFLLSYLYIYFGINSFYSKSIQWK